MAGFISLEEATERLGKSEKEVRSLAKDGRINLVEDNGDVFVSAADVDELSAADSELIDLDAMEEVSTTPEVDLDAIESASGIRMPRERTDEDLSPIALEPEEEEEVPQESGMSKIKAFGGTGIQAAQTALDESSLKRDLQQTGRGATRCRTFHAKLNDGSIAYMNNLINEWVDNNPNIEIKFATSSVGVVEGKHAEPHLILTMFY